MLCGIYALDECGDNDSTKRIACKITSSVKACTTHPFDIFSCF